MMNWLVKARKRGCPLLAVSTPEPLGAVAHIRAHMCQEGGAAWAWDCASGFTPMTEQAQAYGTEDDVDDPARMLQWARTVPACSLIVALWHQEYWQDALVRQGIMNLRDPYKGNGRTLVLMGRGLQVPPGLHSDFLTWEEALPGTDALCDIVRGIEQSTHCVPLGDETSKAVDALRGMTAFEGEQQCAMAVCKNGIDIGALWQAKVKLINSTPGLQYWQGKETREQVVGLEGIMKYLEAEAQGRQPVALILWVDEAEGTFGGAEGDTSGVSQDYRDRIATHMVETEARGMVLAGHSGTGKSHTAKAAGSVFRCPVLALDTGACKGSLVGESESNLRHALAIERAIVGGKPGSTLWLWTTNDPGKIPQKIRSRSQPEWFFDLPKQQEQLTMWKLYMSQYGLESQTFPNFEGWTGREVKQCCFEAWNKRQTLVQAAQWVVPGAVSQAQAIAQRRQQASGRYLDACQGGVYRWAGDSAQARRIEG